MREIAVQLSGLGNSDFFLPYLLQKYFPDDRGAGCATQRGCALGSSIIVQPKSSVSPHMQGMETRLLTLVQLRTNAADCIRLAEAARTSAHKSIFIEMAERWLTLAEHAEKTQADRYL